MGKWKHKHNLYYTNVARLDEIICPTTNKFLSTLFTNMKHQKTCYVDRIDLITELYKGIDNTNDRMEMHESKIPSSRTICKKYRQKIHTKKFPNHE